MIDVSELFAAHICQYKYTKVGKNSILKTILFSLCGLCRSGHLTDSCRIFVAPSCGGMRYSTLRSLCQNCGYLFLVDFVPDNT